MELKSGLVILILGAHILFAQAQHIKVINPTYLGNYTRNYYGNKAPDNLKVNWKVHIGKGQSIVSAKTGSVLWAGAGWTGQPLLVEEDGKLFIIQGCFDHNLKKIDAETGKTVWSYPFDDILKGTGTIWTQPGSNELVILQGSRLGNDKNLYSKIVPSFRAISYSTGKELWRLNSRQTRSYSRDVDASALLLDNLAYIGLENGIFTVLNPDPSLAETKDGILQPKILHEEMLYTPNDATLHGGNLVTEASPSIMNGHIYLASGSGHVYGFNLAKNQIDWDFYIGSDMDGSPVVTSDSCLLISVEKQYIKGQGGILKLDPKKPEGEAVVWYMPSGDKVFSTWLGGVIGTAAINDRYKTTDGSALAAFVAIDGFTYVIKHQEKDVTKKVTGFDAIRQFDTPVTVFKYKTGPSIATPLLTADRLIVPCYNGLYLFSYDSTNNFKLLAHLPESIEATPVVHNGKVYVAARSGYYYCLGQ